MYPGTQFPKFPFPIPQIPLPRSPNSPSPFPKFPSSLLHYYTTKPHYTNKYKRLSPQYNMRKKIIKVKDWYILPSWGRGLAIGTIIGALLMIPSAFLVKNYYTLPIPILILLICAITGVLLTRNKKSFGLRHK